MILYTESTLLNSMSTHYKTVPGTEQNLSLEQDMHPFDQTQTECSPPHPVLVDGMLGRASVGSLGGYSTRICIELDEQHPDLGTYFVTKYFRINTPGTVTWGHEGKSFSIQKIIEGTHS